MKGAYFLAPAVAALVALPAAAQEIPYHRHYWDGGWGMMFFGPIMMILFIAAIVVLIVLAIRWLGGDRQGDLLRSGKAPLDILKERFARGEIDAQEFEERRRLLEK
jgi:putative membrane protein